MEECWRRKCTNFKIIYFFCSFMVYSTTPSVAQSIRCRMAKSFLNVDMIFHSFSSLSYDRSEDSSKASSPHSSIQSFLLQMTVSSPFLKVIQQLPTFSFSSSCHFYSPLYLSFNNPLWKAVSMQNVTNPVRLSFTYFMQDIPLLLDSNVNEKFQ